MAKKEGFSLTRSFIKHFLRGGLKGTGDVAEALINPAKWVSIVTGILDEMIFGILDEKAACEESKKVHENFDRIIKELGEVKGEQETSHAEMLLALHLQMDVNEEVKDGIQKIIRLLQEPDKAEVPKWFDAAVEKILQKDAEIKQVFLKLRQEHAEQSKEHRGIAKAIEKIDAKRQPNLDDTTDEYKPEEPSSNPYLYRNRWIKFVGRTNEVKQLRSFLGKSEDITKPVLWGVVTGPGGSGKSRLALEFCQEMKDKWWAGFLRSSQGFNEWFGWRPNKPTLIVIDYAASRAKEVGERIKDLYDDHRNFEHPVRILLLEREAVGDEENKFTEEEFETTLLPQNAGTKRGGRRSTKISAKIGDEWIDLLSQGSGPSREVIGKCRYPFGRSGRLQLGRIDDKWLWETICEVIKKRGRNIPENKDEVVAMARDITEGRPLYIAFAADALAGGRNMRQWDKAQLAKFILEREKKRWGNPDNKHINLLAIATMTSGIGKDSKILKDTDLRETIPDINEIDSDRYSMMSGQSVTDKIPQFEPDILGECFVLEHFRDVCGSDFVKEKQTKRLMDTLLKAAWKHEPWGTGWFLGRTAEDFPHDPVLPSLHQLVNVNKNARRYWARMAGDLIRIYGKDKKGLQKAEGLYEQIKELAKKYAGKITLIGEQSKAGAELLECYINAKKMKLAERIYREVCQIAGKHPRDISVLENYSDAASYMIDRYTHTCRAKEARILYDDLQQLVRDYKGDKDDIWFSWTLLSNLSLIPVQMVWCYTRVDQVEQAEKIYKDLELLVKENKKNLDLWSELPENQALAVMYMISCYARKRDTKKAEWYGRELLRLLKKYKIEPIDDVTYCNWGVALGNLAMMKEGAEREELLKREIEKFEKAIKINDKDSVSYYNWGVALGNLAMMKEGAEREELLKREIEKLEKAIKINDKGSDSYCNWGVALGNLAMMKEGAEREELVKREIEKFEKAIKINDKDSDSYCNWGVALWELAEMKEGAEREELVKRAIEKFEKAIKIEPKDKDSYYNWACALMSLAMDKTGGERDRLMEDAEEQCGKCEEIEKQSAVYIRACICAMRGEKEKCREWLKAGERAGMLDSRKEAMEEKCFESVQEERWFKEIHWKGE